VVEPTETLGFEAGAEVPLPPGGPAAETLTPWSVVMYSRYRASRALALADLGLARRLASAAAATAKAITTIPTPTAAE
jgi:hypothetical protein